MKLKDITEQLSPIIQARVDDENKILKGVAVASTRRSQNGYTYSNKAFDTLKEKVNGAKFFLDHPSKDELKSRDGVRSIRDFAGIFKNGRRTGDRITGDLYVTEQFWPLMKGIVELAPQGVGMSINSKCYVSQENGQESVTDIHTLNSIDCVTSASLVGGIWESIKNKENSQYNLESAFEEGVRYGRELAAKESKKKQKQESNKMGNFKDMNEYFKRENKKAKDVELEEAVTSAVIQDEKIVRTGPHSTIGQRDTAAARRRIREQKEFEKISDEDEEEVLESLGSQEYRDVSESDMDEVLRCLKKKNSIPG